MERYLRSSIENELGLEWNQQMLRWVKDAIHYWNGARDGQPVDEREAARLEARYGRILKTAKEEYEYVPPSDYFRDGYNLYKRMEADKADYLLFLHDFAVGLTNNLAERDGRKFKRKAAQAMGFQSMEGPSYFCDGLSVIQTMKLRGEDIYGTVASLFNNVREAGG